MSSMKMPSCFLLLCEIFHANQVWKDKLFLGGYNLEVRRVIKWYNDCLFSVDEEDIFYLFRERDVWREEIHGNA